MNKILKRGEVAHTKWKTRMKSSIKKDQQPQQQKSEHWRMKYKVDIHTSKAQKNYEQANRSFKVSRILLSKSLRRELRQFLTNKKINPIYPNLSYGETWVLTFHQFTIIVLLKKAKIKLKNIQVTTVYFKICKNMAPMYSFLSFHRNVLIIHNNINI